MDYPETKKGMKLLAENLDIGYGSDKIVFPGIRFLAFEGDMVALLGVNGIGKSTLLRTMAALQNKIGGNLTVEGKEINQLAAQERARLLSIVLTERIFIDNITVKDFVALGRAPYTSWLGSLSDNDRQVINEVIALVKIEKLQDKLFNQCSDGEKQKALIARALCQQTPVIILDEPTAFLDFRNKREIMQLLFNISRELKKTIILSTHDIEGALQYCNKCWIMTEEREFIEVNRSDNFENEVREKLQMNQPI